MTEYIELSAELTDEQAMALAQFCKRVGFVDFDNNAVDQAEAYQMMYAHGKVYSALRQNGYDPR